MVPMNRKCRLRPSSLIKSLLSVVKGPQALLNVLLEDLCRIIKGHEQDFVFDCNRLKSQCMANTCVACSQKRERKGLFSYLAQASVTVSRNKFNRISCHS
jgi:hypothetical protein